jgi:choline kinase
MVKAIITAAGLGTRMGVMSDVPKCALRVDDITIIERAVLLLLSLGIEVAVVTGYKSEIIEEILSKYPVKIYFNPFYREHGSILSLWSALSFIEDEEDLLVLNADLFWDMSLIEKILLDQRDIVVLADRSKVEHGVGDFFLKVDSEGCVIKYGKSLKKEDRCMESFGISKISKKTIPFFKKEVLKKMKDHELDTWWAIVLYDSNLPVHTLDVSDLFWLEVDYSKDYENLLEYLKNGDFGLKYDMKMDL